MGESIEEMNARLPPDMRFSDTITLGMPMTEVRPGMRLRSTSTNVYAEEIEVTGLTERGFKYRFPDDQPLVDLHWSMPVMRDGHEHFGLLGRALYVPVPAATVVEGTR